MREEIPEQGQARVDSSCSILEAMCPCVALRWLLGILSHVARQKSPRRSVSLHIPFCQAEGLCSQPPADLPLGSWVRIGSLVLMPKKKKGLEKCMSGTFSLYCGNQALPREKGLGVWHRGGE